MPMTTRITFPTLLLLVVAALPLSDANGQGKGRPIIDVHLHAMAFDSQGPYLSYICASPTELPARDHAVPWGAVFSRVQDSRGCSRPIASQPNDDALMHKTLEILERNKVIAVTGGPLDYVERWREAAPDRIISGVIFRLTPDAPTPETLQAWFEEGRIAVLGEVTLQYQGIQPDDPRFEPWLATLEEIDMPTGHSHGARPSRRVPSWVFELPRQNAQPAVPRGPVDAAP